LDYPRGLPAARAFPTDETLMITHDSTPQTAWTATEMFTAAVWVLRSLAVAATMFVALRVVSWMT
jgi:hypothetical protein